MHLPDESIASHGVGPRLSLPSGFELRVYDEVDDVVETAAELARGAAEEGTVVWAHSQRGATTSNGKPWYAPPGNLSMAIVLRPEFPRRRAEELVAVHLHSVGLALSALLEPMTGLRYGWPNKLYLNHLKAGQTALAVEPNRGANPVGYDWMVLGLMLNVAHHPPQPEPEQYNSVHASGSPEVEAGAIIEAYCRCFLQWINRWAEEGFEPVRRLVMQRLEGLGEPYRGRVGEGIEEGVIVDVDSEGQLVVERDGRRAHISVADLFGVAHG